MIQGLKLDFSSNELVNHFTEREHYHRDKSAWYEKQTGDLTTSIDEEGFSVSNDPRAQLKASMRRHREKAAFFSLIKQHVVPNEVYRLDQSDLLELDFYVKHF